MDSVTLAWSSQDDLKKLDQLVYPKFSIPIERVGFGLVGDHGTVLRDQDIAAWDWK